MGTRSRLGELLEVLAATIATVDGTGAYNYSLAGSDQVKLGESDPIAPLPQVQLFMVAEGDSERGRTKGRTLHRWRIPFAAYVGANSSTEMDRGIAAADLLSDIRRALQVEPTLNNLTEDVVLRNCAVLGAELERFPGVGVATGEIHVQYELAAGN